MPGPPAPARGGAASWRPSDGPRLRAQRNRQLVRAWELLEMPQRELLEEQGRRSVHQWTAHPLPTSGDVDQRPLLQRLEDRAAVHAADFLDLGAPDRLPVGDDGQRLERGPREAMWPGGQLRPLDGVRVFRARQDLPPFAQFHELDPVAIGLVRVPDLA